MVNEALANTEIVDNLLTATANLSPRLEQAHKALVDGRTFTEEVGAGVDPSGEHALQLIQEAEGLLEEWQGAIESEASELQAKLTEAQETLDAHSEAVVEGTESVSDASQK